MAQGHCFRLLFIILLLLFNNNNSFCCTSVIVTAERSGIGRPVMLKHRDTGKTDNKIEMFHGEHFDFIGLVNSDWKVNPVAPTSGGVPEVWCGMNSAGFCIMDTASYNIKDDNVPASRMDREGVLMYMALGVCESLSDFENFIDSLPRPLGVEGNFGVIDSFGGAAYYEINNYRVVKYDVHDECEGYMVVTNFSRSGRIADRRGVDRYEKACSIFSGMEIFDHKTIINSISRSGKPILRPVTSASIVFEGTSPGKEAVMWTCLGYPATIPYYPLVISREIPSVMTAPGSENALLCDISLRLKEKGENVDDIILEIEKVIDREFEKVTEND